MLNDARDRKFDSIFTKSVSRFARNTTQLLETVRELRDLGIEIFFENENISTLQPASELYLTIAATIAENDLAVDAARQRWSIQRRYEEGWVSIGNGVMYGLRQVDDDKLVVVPEEAEIIREIFDKYIGGDGIVNIANSLNRRGILNSRGAPWRPNNILKIISNERYMGDIMMGRSVRVAYYTTFIHNHPDWIFGGIYADPGISGTRAESRPDFMRMINDCRDGKINKILVKSISRFARNTVDALQYIRELRDLNVSVQFENENIDTMTSGGEVLLTILAAIAEQESRTISSNIKWAIQKRNERGEVVINTGCFLGYKKVGNHEYEINEEEADIVRRIYHEYLSGMSTSQICRGLERDGVKTKHGKDRWYPRTILNMLTNEKYAGNAILGKTYKPDIMSKRRMKNEGQAPMFYATNTHPAIIDQEMFDLVQSEVERREYGSTASTGSTRYTSKYPLSGLLVCGYCQHKLRRHVRTMGYDGKKVAAWGCTNRISNGRDICDSRHINERVLEATYSAAVQELAGSLDDIVRTVGNNVGLALEPENRKALEHTDAEIVAIQTQVLDLHKKKQKGKLAVEEFNAALEGFSSRMDALEQERDQLQSIANRYAMAKTWISDFEQYVHAGGIVNIENGVVIRALTDEIVVFDDHMEIHFKCGVVHSREYVK